MNDMAYPIESEAPARSPGEILRKDFIMPLATLTCLLVLTLTVFLHLAVRSLNQESAAREQQLARNGLALRVEEVATSILPQTDWDDAVRYLDNRYDAAWAASNFNEFLDHTFGFDASYVLDANDQPLFAAVAGTVVPSSRYAEVAPAAAKLVRSVREAEKRRGPVRRNEASPDVISKPNQASLLTIVDGKLAILTASLVQPDFGTALPKGPRSPIVITKMLVDKAFLTTFSQRHLLDDVQVRLPTQPARPETVEIPVTDDAGRIQAYLGWRPHDPGYAMMRRLALPLVMALVMILAIAAIEFRRILRSAHSLVWFRAV